MAPLKKEAAVRLETLVDYLEAMAVGCIPVASRGEGFDGIIIDGENGFLCAAGDSQELASIIKKIRNLSDEEKLRIINKAIETAVNMTDSAVARHYLEEIVC